MNCFDVARYFLAQVDDDAGDSISNLKLQKLVYYAQGYHLAFFGTLLFPEKIEAWAHGPVIPDLYHALKKFGSGPVSLDGELNLEKFPKPVCELLDEVYLVYGQFSAAKLRNITHNEPPWANTPPGKVISPDLMMEYFKTQITT